MLVTAVFTSCIDLMIMEICHIYEKRLNARVQAEKEVTSLDTAVGGEFRWYVVCCCVVQCNLVWYGEVWCGEVG